MTNDTLAGYRRLMRFLTTGEMTTDEQLPLQAEPE